MDIRQDRLYTKEHEWVRQEDGRLYVGVSDHAQEAMGAVVFVELPAIGKVLGAGDVCTVVESVKAASSVYTPVAGTVVEVNSQLEDQPERINEAPYDAWIVCLEISDGLPESLMDGAAYQIWLAEGKESS